MVLDVGEQRALGDPAGHLARRETGGALEGDELDGGDPGAALAPEEERDAALVNAPDLGESFLCEASVGSSPANFGDEHVSIIYGHEGRVYVRLCGWEIANPMLAIHGKSPYGESP